MTKEWFFVLGATVLAGILFLFCDNETVAALSWLSLTSATCMIVFIVIWGRRARRVREGVGNEIDAVDIHQVFIAIFTTFVLVGVVGIEVLVRGQGGLWGGMRLKIFHFFFVFLAVVSFAMVKFHITGIADRTRHKKFAYFFLASYLFVYSSGTVLLLEKFPSK